MGVSIGGKSISVVKARAEKKAIMAKIQTKHGDGAETTKQVKLGDVVITEPMCNVGMSVSKTINLGNYESVRIEVSLHMPCYENAVEKTFQFEQKWIDAKLEELTSGHPGQEGGGKE